MNSYKNQLSRLTDQIRPEINFAAYEMKMVFAKTATHTHPQRLKSHAGKMEEKPRKRKWRTRRTNVENEVKTPRVEIEKSFR